MKIPVISGTIRRRFLINFRVRLDAMRYVLPSPFEPKPHRRWGIAGICLIRLEGIHPKATPLPCGFNSENAAHRFAVQWNEDGVSQAGVFIPRRDTDSLLNHLAGGRLFQVCTIEPCLKFFRMETLTILRCHLPTTR